MTDKDIKKKAIEEALAGISKQDIAAKYDIKYPTLCRWVKAHIDKTKGRTPTKGDLPRALDIKATIIKAHTKLDGILEGGLTYSQIKPVVDSVKILNDIYKGNPEALMNDDARLDKMLEGGDIPIRDISDDIDKGREGKDMEGLIETLEEVVSISEPASNLDITSKSPSVTCDHDGHNIMEENNG